MSETERTGGHADIRAKQRDPSTHDDRTVDSGSALDRTVPQVPGEVVDAAPEETIDTSPQVDASEPPNSSVPSASSRAAGAPMRPASIAIDLPRPPPHAPRVNGYRVTGRLGEGGMGVVWRAVQLSTRREVALKVMGAAGLGSERARLRFEREVELSARLDHPGIAKVFDGGLDHGLCFYAMELVDGVPLSSFARDGKLDRRRIVALMRDVCRAVQHAHQRGIIHRDLKPSNILVTPDGQPKVLDFGLAKALEADQQLSVDGEVAGTPAYMSPEQAAGHPDKLDTRSDVYTLGVILFQMLTGQFPHDISGTYLEVLRRVAEQEPRRLSDLEPRPDVELQAILAKALDRDPDRRYATGAGLGDDLGRYLSGDPVVARSPTLTYLARKRIRKYKLPLAVAAAVLAALAGTAALSYVRVVRARDAAIAAEHDKEQQRAETQRQKEGADRHRVEADRQRGIADAERAAADVQRAAAEERLAQSLISQGDGLILTARGAEAIARFSEARDVLVRLNRPTTAADLSWFEAHRRLPPPVLTFPTKVDSILVGPDGRTVIVGDYDAIYFFDRTTGQVLRPALKHGNGHTFALAITPDGRQLLSGSERDARLWDLSTGRLVHVLKGEASSIKGVAFLPGGAGLSVDNRGGYRVWDLARGTEVRRFGDGGVVYRMAVSPDGRLALAGGNTPTLRLWDIAAGKVLRAEEEPGVELADVAFSPDGRTVLVARTNGSVPYQEVASGKELRRYRMESAHVAAVAFTADGRSAWLGGRDRTLRLWDLTSGEFTRSLGAPAPQGEAAS